MQSRDARTFLSNRVPESATSTSLGIICWCRWCFCCCWLSCMSCRWNDWDTGWIAKSTYFLCPQCGSRILMDPPRRVYLPRGPPRCRSRRVYDDFCSRVSTVSAGSSCDQQSMGSLTGFSIPCRFLGCHWHRSRHGLDRCQRTSPLRLSLMIRVRIGYVVMGAPPGGTHHSVESVLGPNSDSELDSTLTDSDVE